MMEKTSTKKRGGPVRFKEKVVVKYLEHSPRSETWLNYYVFDYDVKLIKQFKLMKKFFDVFEACSTKHFAIILKRYPMSPVRRTAFTFALERKADLNETLQAFSRPDKKPYKKSNCYLFSGRLLPHYLQIAAFLEKYNLRDGPSLKRELKKVLDDYEVYRRVYACFYEVFGEYDKQSGVAERMIAPGESVEYESDKADESDESDEEDEECESDEANESDDSSEMEE